MPDSVTNFITALKITFDVLLRTSKDPEKSFDADERTSRGTFRAKFFILVGKRHNGTRETFPTYEYYDRPLSR